MESNVGPVGPDGSKVNVPVNVTVPSAPNVAEAPANVYVIGVAVPGVGKARRGGNKIAAAVKVKMGTRRKSVDGGRRGGPTLCDLRGACRRIEIASLRSQRRQYRLSLREAERRSNLARIVASRGRDRV
jgi:hypothetical protein